MPCRLRTSRAANTGKPQSSFLSSERAGPISQRVSAVLGSGTAAKRKSTALTPLCAAAKVRRRLATRSRHFACPTTSISTAPKAAQLRPSLAARKALVTSAARKSSTRSGSRPSSRRPQADSSPYSRAEKSWRIQSSVLPCPARRAKAAAKAPAAASLPACAAKTSCSAPVMSPPFRQASAPSWPSGMRGCVGTSFATAVWRRGIMTRNNPCHSRRAPDLIGGEGRQPR